MRAPQALELEAVLEHAQDAVIARELGGLLATDVPALGEGRESRKGAALPDGGVGRAVHELQELHRELDVAQSTRAELDLHVDLPGGDVLRDTLAHALHGLHEPFATRARPDLGRDTGRVPRAQLGVARERTGLQERLELPALRPPVVVLEVRLECAHECAVLALWAEIRVDLPQWGLDARL